MANITVSVRSLWGASIYRSITIDNAQTVEALIAAVAAEDNLQSDYYNIYLTRNNNINNLNNGDSATSLSSLGIITGDIFVTKSRAAEVALYNKGEAQRMKLEIAQAKRQADGDTTAGYYRAANNYDITKLPTQYVGNTIVDNDNSSGLEDGRPWSDAPLYSAGLYRTQYTGWPNQNTANPTWFDTATAGGTAAGTTNFVLSLTAGQPNLAYQWIGYIKPDWTGTWTFTTSGVTIDDCLIIWIGSSALSGYTTGNSVANISLASGSGTISLTANTYYPIRVQYANNSGPGTNHLRWSRNSSTPSTDFSSLVYYNPATNGF